MSSRDARTRSLVLIAILLSSVGTVHAQVVLDGNQLVGTVEVTNTHPQILAEIHASSASIDASAADLNSNTTVPTTTPTRAEYSLTVDAGEPGQGIVYDVTSGLHNGRYWYYLAGTTSAPVEKEPAPDVVVDFAECAGLLRARWVDPQGDPVTIRDARSFVFDESSPGSGNFNRIRAGSNRLVEQSEFTVLLPGHGLTSQVRFTLFGEQDHQILRFASEVTGHCDEVLEMELEIVWPGRPEPDYGSITGRADLVGEDESRAGIYAAPGVRLVTQTLSTPLPATFELQNVLATEPLNLDGYRVRLNDVRLGSGYEYQRFYSPFVSPRTPVATDETTDLGDALVLIPGYLAGDMYLAGPIADDPTIASCVDALDRRENSFGGSRLFLWGRDEVAPGATQTAIGGFNNAGIGGSFDPVQSAFDGSFEMVLGGVRNEPTYWRPLRMDLRFSRSAPLGDGSNVLDSFSRIYDQREPRILIESGETTRHDVRVCFSEVNVGFTSLSGDIYEPYLDGRYDFVGVDFESQSADYTGSVWARGVPTAIDDAAPEGQVKLCVPQGQHALDPSMQVIESTGEISTVNLPTLDLTVGCRQVLDVRSEIQIALDPVPACAPSTSVDLAGSVTASLAVDRIVAEINGQTSTLCTDCGENPTYAGRAPLAACANAIRVVATDRAGREASISTSTIRDVEPPPIAGCADLQRTVTHGLAGAVVTYDVTAVDACEGSMPVECSIDSGSLFPIGTTSVTCSARDFCGNASSCTFDVTVAEDLLIDDGTACRIDDFDDGLNSGAWTLTALGDATQVAMDEPGALHVTATGSRLYRGADHGAFVHRDADGDFRVEIDVTDVPVDLGGTYRKGGLQIRDGLDPLAPRAMIHYVPHFPTPDTPALMFDYRDENGNERTLASTVEGISLPVRLALERRGDVVTAYYSTDGGTTWIQPLGGEGGSVPLAMADTVQVGMSVASYDTLQPATFAFDRFTLCEPRDGETPPSDEPCTDAPLDVVVLLDLSGSMTAASGDDTKLDAALASIRRLSEALSVRGDGSRLGLVTYTVDDPLHRPAMDIRVRRILLDEFDRFDALLDELAAPRTDDGTPIALGFRSVQQMLDEIADPAHRSVVVWASDGLPNFDDEGRGPRAYRPWETSAISLRNPDGSFRTPGEVAWSGNYNPEIDTYDGEVLADVQLVLEAMLATQPDLRVYGLVPRGETMPEALFDYAAYLSGGAVFGAVGAEALLAEVPSLLAAMTCDGTELGGLGDRVWHDLDGDGVQDAGELGLEGVVVDLLDTEGATLASAITDLDGSYAFVGVAPGNVRVEIDPTTLPADLDEATHDLDGAATAGSTAVTLGPWQARTDVDFGYRERVDSLGDGCLFDDFEDGTLDAAWSLVGLGDADDIGAEAADGGLLLTGDGSSLFKLADNAAFLYQRVGGDFRVEVDLDGFPVDQGGSFRKAGLMVRTGLGDLAPRVMVQFVPHWEGGERTGLQFRYRATEGGPGNRNLASDRLDVPAPVRLAIEREGRTFRVFYSTDGGETWNVPGGGAKGSVDLPAFGDEALVGLALASYDPELSATARFDDLELCALPTTP